MKLTDENKQRLDNLYWYLEDAVPENNNMVVGSIIKNLEEKEPLARMHAKDLISNTEGTQAEQAVKNAIKNIGL